MITIANANALYIPLADQSVQCVVTSPPYWGLRDYGTAKWEGGSAECDHVAERSIKREMHQTHASGRGSSDTEIHVSEFPQGDCIKCGARRIDAQIGLESTPAAYVAHIVAVMRECWRVLKDDGTLWLNLGDSYAMSSVRGENSKFSGAVGAHKGYEQGSMRLGSKQIPTGLKPKDLCGIPWRVAFALQEDGWYLRSDIIWAKPNPMPESVTDRPTKAHEYVFLLTKRERYYYDAEAIKETGSIESAKRLERGVSDNHKNINGAPGQTPHSMNQPRPNTRNGNDEYEIGTRNRRSVWTVATQPYSGAHFATFPPALIEPMILAGTSARGECPHCGKAWVRVVERNASLESGRLSLGYGISTDAGGNTTNGHNGSTLHHDIESVTLGWRQQCTCPPHEPIPQTVLDQFAGSGTTGVVAVKHGRKAVLLDLNTKYIDLQFERNSKIQITMPM